MLKEYGASDGDKVVIVKTFDEKLASKDVSDSTTAVSTALFWYIFWIMGYLTWITQLPH